MVKKKGWENGTLLLKHFLASLAERSLVTSKIFCHCMHKPPSLMLIMNLTVSLLWAKFQAVLLLSTALHCLSLLLCSFMPEKECSLTAITTSACGHHIQAKC